MIGDPILSQQQVVRVQFPNQIIQRLLGALKQEVAKLAKVQVEVD